MVVGGWGVGRGGHCEDPSKKVLSTPLFIGISGEGDPLPLDLYHGSGSSPIN